jgi:hypothetical protein
LREATPALTADLEPYRLPTGLDRIALLGAAGLPFRVLTLFAAAGALALSDPAHLLGSIRRFRRILLLILFAALLGTLVSLVAGTPGGTIAAQLVEIHVQAAIGVLVAGTLALRLGIRAVILALLAGFATTAIVAAGQALGLDPAWDLRAVMGDLTNDPPITRLFYELRERPMGMSHSPVIFAQQAILMLALLLLPLLTRSGGGSRFSWLVPISCVAIAIFCIATGNRSPLLGMAIFLATYLAFTLPRTSLVLLPLFGALAFFAEPVLEDVRDTGVRAVRADSSSENRGTLRQFGVRLIADRPVGYGFDFESTRYGDAHISALKYESSPGAIRLWALHNYYLLALCKYGLFILLMIPWIIPRTGPQLRAWWAFLPYIIHIFFHNDGPLSSDFIFFFVLPIAMMLTSAPDEARHERRTRRRSLRRAAA